MQNVDKSRRYLWGEMGGGVNADGQSGVLAGAHALLKWLWLRRADPCGSEGCGLPGLESLC